MAFSQSLRITSYGRLFKGRQGWRNSVNHGQILLVYGNSKCLISASEFPKDRIIFLLNAMDMHIGDYTTSMQAMCRFIPLPFAEWILCQHSKKQKKSDPMLCSLFRNRFPLSDNGIRCFHAYTNIYYMMWCIFAEKSPETWR